MSQMMHRCFTSIRSRSAHNPLFHKTGSTDWNHIATHTHTFLFPIVIETPIIPLSTLSLSLCDIKNDMLDVVHLNPINSLTSCLLPCLHICRWILINKIMQRFNDRVGCSLYVHIGLYIHNNIGLFVLGSAFGDESG